MTDFTALSIAGTFSKDPSLWGFTEEVFVERGRGAEVQLNDGDWYLDWVSALGQNLFGYSIDWSVALINQAVDGAGFSLPHRLEYEVAEKLADMLSNNVPKWKSRMLKVRFCKTGSEATTMAIRLARAITGKDNIICFSGHYHGWNDWTVARTPPALGVPKEDYVQEAKFGDIDSLEEAFNIKPDVAAVIFEHPSWDYPAEWYKDLVKTCKSHKALLIADEVVTGLRYGLGGACERFGITPDLMCMGKAMGNGMPIAALVGPKEYMEWFSVPSPVFCSSTTWGEAVSLVAADFVLSVWDKECVDHLWKVGARLKGVLGKSSWKVSGHSARSILEFDNDYERAFFIQGMYHQGVLMNRPNFPNMAHSDRDVEYTGGALVQLREMRKKYTSKQVKRMMSENLPRVLFRER